MKTAKYIEIEERYGAHNYHPLDIVIKKAEGVWVEDVEGNRYIDFLAAKERGFDFNATAIGSDFPEKYIGPFNRAYMNKLYDHGYQKARHGAATLTLIAERERHRSFGCHIEIGGRAYDEGGFAAQFQRYRREVGRRRQRHLPCQLYRLRPGPRQRRPGGRGACLRNIQ